MTNRRNDDLETRDATDELCARFRSQWSSPTESSIERFLSGENGGQIDYAKVILRLIQHEVELRRKSGDSPSQQEYCERFPELESSRIAELFSLPAPPPPEVRKPVLPLRYRVIEEIGRGGIGTVWRIHDKELDRPLAAKILHDRYREDAAANARLDREALLTGSLQHPGIPPIHERGKLISGSSYFTMKLVGGETLAKSLGSRESASENLARFIGVFQQVAQTVAYAHSQKIIHRDLKPQNIMVGEFGEVQIMDWGMAKRLGDPNDAQVPKTSSGKIDKPRPVGKGDTALASIDSSLPDPMRTLTKQGDIFGTPAYMPPEQARGQLDEMSERSDVFGLGAILYEILTSSRLYDDVPDEDVVAAATKGILGPSLRNLDRLARRDINDTLTSDSLDHELVNLCKDCLAVSPGDRPSNGQAVADRITNYIASVEDRLKQVEIQRNAALIQSNEQRKRGKVIAGMSALVIAITVIAAIGIGWQWNKAVVSADRAQSEVETRRQVNNFLILDMLRLADPGVEPDRDLKLRTVLDRAAEKISTRFQDRPDVEAEIRLQIGRSYGGLGEYQAAKEHFEIAAEINLELFGEESDEYWLVYKELAKTEHELGNYDDALPMLKKVDARNRAEFGENSSAALTSKSAVASCVMMLGDTKEATELEREVVDQLQKHVDDQVLINRHRAKLAHLEFQLSNYDEAEKLLIATIESMENEMANQPDGKPLEGDIDYIQALHTIGLIQDARGQFEDGEDTHRKTVQMATKLLGAEHPRRLQLLNNLAISLLNREKTAEAKTILDEAIPAMEAAIGSDHDITFSALNTLAGVHFTNKDFEKAEQVFLKAREGLLEKFDPPHQGILTNTNNIAGLLQTIGRLDEAEPWSQQAYEEALELYGENHRYTITSLANLALIHRKLGRNDQAETEYKDAIRLCEKNLAADHPDTLVYKRGLAFLYELNDRFGEAEPILRESIALMEAAPDQDHAMLAAQMNRLAYALLKQEKIVEAIDWYVATYDSHRIHRGETDAKTLSVFWALIATEEKDDRWRTVMQRLDRLNNLIGPVDEEWLSLRIESRLGNTLSHLGELEDAEFLLLNSFELQQLSVGVPEEERFKGLRKTAGFLVDHYELVGDSDRAGIWQIRLNELNR